MKYGLIGKKLGHSYSKTIHALLGNGEYELREIAPEALDDFLRARDFAGLNVTIPYKERVLPFCEIDAAARKIGCVNTLVNRNGTLFGYNTDYAGFLFMTQQAGIDFAGKKVLVLGSGGTSKTARCVARDRGASEVVVISRRAPQAGAAEETGEALAVQGYESLGRYADADILINTTPVGMFPDNESCPVDLSFFPRLGGLADVIYNPLRTRLVLEAQKRGLPCSSGLVMLAAQAVYAHNRFFGLEEEPSVELIKDITAQTEKQYRNIVLVGMPGTGKTTIGKKLAARRGLAFADTDVLIREAYGKNPADIITEKGEDFFRDAESAVIRAACKKTGQVIATGGGAVLRETNRDALRSNGFVVFLERPLEELSTKGRPLSAGSGTLRELFAKREGLYRAVSDVCLRVAENPDKTVFELEKLV